MSRQAESLRAWSSRQTPQQRSAANVVVVAGGKGGTGVSTTSTLLAFGAAAVGRNTLLIDATPAGNQLGDLLALSRSLPNGNAPGTPAWHRVSPLLTMAELTHAANLSTLERRSALRRIASRYNDYEFVVVDAGSTAEAVSIALAAGAGRLLAVTNADRLSVVATYALVKYMAERFTELPIAVLVNRSEPVSGSEVFGRIAAGVAEFLDTEVTPAGSLPEDDGLRKAAETGLSPFITDTPSLHAARLLAELLLVRPERRGAAMVQVI